MERIAPSAQLEAQTAAVLSHGLSADGERLAELADGSLVSLLATLTAGPAGE
jgi:hypothetical protein